MQQQQQQQQQHLLFSNAIASNVPSSPHQENQIHLLLPNSPSSSFYHNMRRKTRTTFISFLITIILFASFSLLINFFTRTTAPLKNPSTITSLLLALHQHEVDHHSREQLQLIHRLYDSTPSSILFPDWELLLVFPPQTHLPSDPTHHFTCIFQNNHTSPAKPAGILPFNNRPIFKCALPIAVRRLRRPYLQPIFSTSPPISLESPELFRWSFLAYETLSTQNDVILFVKGVNHRQGVNRSPEDLRCVFFNGVNSTVKTPVITSNQEVFRCHHPNTIGTDSNNIKVSLEIRIENYTKIVPSVAYYAPKQQRSIVEKKEKSLICACTMVYNVAKFLKEWVVYNAKIGVEKFLLYDNGSEDELERVVIQLRESGFDVETIYWPWSKTQEAGFSHGATYASDKCTWMMYIDVDEFIYSPSWLNSPYPSSHMLRSLLPKSHQIGQIIIKCYEFGPSNQRSHPKKGVTQGYTCRSRIEQRHKSILLLEAIEPSLVNVVHHFELKQGYRVKRMSLEEGVVNHYKYQAWCEFKSKFRRRVSAYVVDWRKVANPRSKDRTPGLGFEPIEPKGWAKRFCDVRDYRLREATQRWFGLRLSSGYKMVWQDL